MKISYFSSFRKLTLYMLSYRGKFVNAQGFAADKNITIFLSVKSFIVKI